jgi:hypothetical protein
LVHDGPSDSQAAKAGIKHANGRISHNVVSLRRAKAMRGADGHYSRLIGRSGRRTVLLGDSMSQDSLIKRPVGVTIVAILIILAAIGNIVVGTLLIFSAFGENPTFINHITGEEQTVSGFYLWFNGGLMILLGLIYFWLSKMTMIGSASAHMLISLLAVLNIIFGFFNLGYGGWGQIIVNVIILLIINTTRAKLWFLQSP